jgi:hypothetical protein
MGRQATLVEVSDSPKAAGYFSKKHSEMTESRRVAMLILRAFHAPAWGRTTLPSQRARSERECC